MHYLVITLFAFPAIVSAQEIFIGDFQDLLVAAVTVMNQVFPVLVAIAVFVIILGIFKFILNAADPEARKTGAATIFWGIIGVFLMMSVWGLINIMVNSFELNNTPIQPPTFFIG